MAALGAKGALALTAHDVLNKMSAEEQAAYLAGVVGGLAYSRYVRDTPDTSGMACIHDWYFAGETERQRQIMQWLERHSEKPAEPLLYVLIRKECGD